MRNASLPNIFLASKSFSQYYLADIFSPCIVPHKAMQSFLYPISHTLSHARVRVYARDNSELCFLLSQVSYIKTFLVENPTQSRL